MKKGLDRKSRKLAKLHSELREKRANIEQKLFEERLKVEQRYMEKEKQLQNFMKDLEEKDKKLNQGIINLEVEKIKLMQSLSKKPIKENLIPGSAVDMWPLKMAVGIQQSNSEDHKEVLKDLPSMEFGEELKKPNVKKI